MKRYNFSTDDIISIAAGLISESGENPEYDRAIVEMTCDLLGLPITDSRDTISEMISLARRS